MTPEELDQEAAMTPEELDQEAAMLYGQRVQERGPRWEQLGDVTKSVWREYVLAGERAELW